MSEMNERPDNGDEDEDVQLAAEHAERAGQERQQQRRKASLAGDADDPGEADELECESGHHRQAAGEEEAASSESVDEDT